MLDYELYDHMINFLENHTMTEMMRIVGKVIEAKEQDVKKMAKEMKQQSKE